MPFSLRWAGLLAVAAAALALSAQPAPAQHYGGGAALELFEGPNFTGRSVVFSADDHNLMNQRFNDRAMSARLIGGQPWEVCVDAEYRGGCVRLERDEPDLRRIGMSQAISSVRRVSLDWQAPYPGGGYPPPYGGGYGGQEGLAGRTAAFFPYPTYEGRPIPACPGRGSGNSCAQRSADEYCQFEGYRGARYFSAQGRGRNAVLEDVLCIY
jgi:hypothetical protein